MHYTINNLNVIKKEINNIKPNVNIIAVSKTFNFETIEPLVKNGHLHFGENKVQEAVAKWSEIKKSNKNLQLHMLGKLQTNKVKYAVPLFDYIHSLDNIKLAEKISSEQIKVQKKLKIFIQVNIGNEKQKNGILKNEVKSFFDKCVEKLNLDIVGLMCIPPKENSNKDYFGEMMEIKKKIGLENLSMGMSSDYLDAIKAGSNFVRIGSKIFGDRN
jgi:pyridoxal phosphate enzyme (YggS family)